MDEKGKKVSGFLKTQAIPVGRKKRNPDTKRVSVSVFRRIL